MMEPKYTFFIFFHYSAGRGKLLKFNFIGQIPATSPPRQSKPGTNCARANIITTTKEEQQQNNNAIAQHFRLEAHC